MKRLITIDEQTFGRTPTDNHSLPRRNAARAVVFNQNGGVYLLNVTSHGYHKLPGGGIDDGEEIGEALKREILEEVGCDSEVGDELGEVLEYRVFEDFNVEQLSYCFVATQIGELGEQSLEQGEIDEGHDLVIAQDLDDAISILENGNPNNIEGQYIKLRDLTILKEAKNKQTPTPKAVL